MFDQILFPTDGSDGAAFVLDHAIDLAAHHGATLHLLNVVDTSRSGPLSFRADDRDALENEGERIVEEAAEKARGRDVDTITYVRRGDPYREIADFAAKRSFYLDLIVMPTHGRRGLERFLIGSTTERVVRRADTPVLTVRPADDARLTHPYRDVLVPTDGSDCADRAVTIGVEVAAAEDAALHLLSVVAMRSLGIDARSHIQANVMEERAEEVLDEAAAIADDAGVGTTSTSIEYGPSIHRAILGYVDEHGVGLVVVGTHGRTGFDRYVLGSVTEYLVRTSPIPVLTVRGSDPET
jgi:nucleotide-binding universal stress UspA family protein